MNEYKLYYPYKSTRHDKKFMVLLRDGKMLHFGDSRYQHYTEGHLDEKRRIHYDQRNRTNR